MARGQLMEKQETVIEKLDEHRGLIYCGRGLHLRETSDFKNIEDNKQRPWRIVQRGSYSIMYCLRGCATGGLSESMFAAGFGPKVGTLEGGANSTLIDGGAI